MRPKPKNEFERMMDVYEDKHKKPFSSFLKKVADDLPTAETIYQEFDQAGIKDIIGLPEESFKKLLKTGNLAEKAPRLTGHPQLGQTEVGDLIGIIYYDDNGKMLGKKAKLIELTKDEKGVDYWKIELVEE